MNSSISSAWFVEFGEQRHIPEEPWQNKVQSPLPIASNSVIGDKQSTLWSGRRTAAKANNDYKGDFALTVNIGRSICSSVSTERNNTVTGEKLLEKRKIESIEDKTQDQDKVVSSQIPEEQGKKIQEKKEQSLLPTFANGNNPLPELSGSFITGANNGPVSFRRNLKSIELLVPQQVIYEYILLLESREKVFASILSWSKGKEGGFAVYYHKASGFYLKFLFSLRRSKYRELETTQLSGIYNKLEGRLYCKDNLKEYIYSENPYNFLDPARQKSKHIPIYADNVKLIKRH